MKKPPLQDVKDRFGSKEELVEAVRALATDDLFADRLNEDKGLDHVSNAKLLHLHAILSAVKAEFGSRDKLIDALVALESRSADSDYRTRFEPWPTPRLWEAYRATKARAARS